MFYKVNGGLFEDRYIQYSELNLGGYNRTIWVSGANFSGLLGLGDTTHRSSFIQIPNIKGWFSVSTDGNSTLLINNDGTFWGVGLNSSGQLGTNDRIDRSTLTQISNIKEWRTIHNMGDSSFAIKSDGTLWSWGNNKFMRLGYGDQIARSVPTQVGSDTDWKIIELGNSNSPTLAIKNNGTLWGWGCGYSNSFGEGNNNHRSSPAQIGLANDWKSVKPGVYHVLALKTNGELWGWGDNAYGQLGTGDNIDRSAPTQVNTSTDWSSIYSGDICALAIKLDGTLWSWGHNGWGQLGLNSNFLTTISTPTQIGGLTNWKSINSNLATTVLAIKTDGTLWGWGHNEWGQLGDNRIIMYRSSPIQVTNSNKWYAVAANSNTIALQAS